MIVHAHLLKSGKTILTRPPTGDFRLMPSDHRFLINLRGTPEYERALLRLVKAAIKAGAPLEPGELNRMTELAIAAYAKVHNVKLPPRIPPQGTNQHAKRDPKGKPTP